MPTYRNDTEEIIFGLKDTTGRTVTLKPDETLESYKIYDIIGLTKTLESPYFPFVNIFESAFVSPGTKTGLLSAKIIRLTAEGEITVKANHADNPYPLELVDGTAMDIENDGEIESLIFTGTGTVKIEGF